MIQPDVHHEAIYSYREHYIGNNESYYFKLPSSHQKDSIPNTNIRNIYKFHRTLVSKLSHNALHQPLKIYNFNA